MAYLSAKLAFTGVAHASWESVKRSYMSAKRHSITQNVSFARNAPGSWTKESLQRPLGRSIAWNAMKGGLSRSGNTSKRRSWKRKWLMGVFYLRVHDSRQFKNQEFCHLIAPPTSASWNSSPYHAETYLFTAVGQSRRFWHFWTVLEGTQAWSTRQWIPGVDSSLASDRRQNLNHLKCDSARRQSPGYLQFIAYLTPNGRRLRSYGLKNRC